MKTYLKGILILSLCQLATVAHGAMAYQLKGKLLSYNNENITLELSPGERVRVPLSFLTVTQREETHKFLNKEMKVTLNYADKHLINKTR